MSNKYDSMPRGELIAELNAWESKFKEKLIERTSQIAEEYSIATKAVIEAKNNELEEISKTAQRLWRELPPISFKYFEFLNGHFFSLNGYFFPDKHRKYQMAKEAYENFVKCYNEFKEPV